jgi:hypothetical protein
MMLLSILDKPPVRRLRVYALDPSLAQKLQTAPLQEIVLPIRWEQNPKTGRLDVGPIGEYIEVVDVDPASGVVYPPVDLDDPNLLAQDGLPPSEGYPQFHQQMVYAVAMATIERFEQALGRVALWAPRQVTPRDNPEGQWKHEFVRRLRMYPHALRDQNAYYSPDKKAILFGYFPVRTNDARNTPGTTVFACLSHDVIAHEVTHALLDGVHPRFNEQSNPDVPAFHEAFADIVALFQRFSYTDVVRDEIARTRGRLENENMLAKLAQQFGSATGRGSALRDALGMEVDGKWQRRPPDTTILEKTMEPHERGAILVAAVFGAFLLVYGRRTEDLYRIATQGSGVLPEGEIHPDMARRLAEEAAACAGNILRMCIRAIDYCPPVNITFGEYLRAVMTADINIDPEDELRYRVAFVESFRQWGIYPRGTRSMSVEALTWPTGAEVIAESAQQLKLRHGKNGTHLNQESRCSRSEAKPGRYQGILRSSAGGERFSGAVDAMGFGQRSPRDLEAYAGKSASGVGLAASQQRAKILQGVRPCDRKRCASDCVSQKNGRAHGGGTFGSHGAAPGRARIDCHRSRGGDHAATPWLFQKRRPGES